MKEYNPSNDDINYFAKTNFRNREQAFGIRRDDRRRHVYVIGKTGSGKTTMLENMALNDINNGEGVAYFDPHGDSVEKLLNYIPSDRINDVVYFDPHDINFPVGFNILEINDPAQKNLIAAGLMSVFTKVWAGVWSARMEYILNNTILALLDNPGNTLMGIVRMYTDKKFRAKIVAGVKDPVIRNYWEGEFANYSEQYRTEAVAAIQNKVGQFLSSSIMRNIVAQTKSTIDFRDIMDNRKILLVNLSKGRIGEDSSALLGAMMITKLQLAAMSRVDTPETERKDFYLYVDEFQNFATESFATILSEARKYRLNLIVAHQYVAQLFDPKTRSAPVKDAVFGNVGTMVAFRVGAEDAEELEKEFYPVFEAPDIVNLAKYNIYLKLMINGVASTPFSAQTLPPIGEPTNNVEKVIKVSRERYAVPREEIEKKIARWLDVEYFAEVGRHTTEEITEDDERRGRIPSPGITNEPVKRAEPRQTAPEPKPQPRHEPERKPSRPEPRPQPKAEIERKEDRPQPVQKTEPIERPKPPVVEPKVEVKAEVEKIQPPKPKKETNVDVWQKVTEVQTAKAKATTEDLMSRLLEALENTELTAQDKSVAPAPKPKAEDKPETKAAPKPDLKPRDLPTAPERPTSKPEVERQKPVQHHTDKSPHSKAQTNQHRGLKPGERIKFES